MKVELNRTSEDFSHKLEPEDGLEALELKAEGVTLGKAVYVELLISKNKDQLVCQSKVRVSVKLECFRCLAGYGHTITSDLNFVVDLTGGSKEVEESGEEGYFVSDPSATCFEIDDPVR